MRFLHVERHSLRVNARHIPGQNVNRLVENRERLQLRHHDGAQVAEGRSQAASHTSTGGSADGSGSPLLAVAVSSRGGPGLAYESGKRPSGELCWRWFG